MQSYSRESETKGDQKDKKTQQRDVLPRWLLLYDLFKIKDGCLTDKVSGLCETYWCVLMCVKHILKENTSHQNEEMHENLPAGSCRSPIGKLPHAHGFRHQALWRCFRKQIPHVLQ